MEIDKYFKGPHKDKMSKVLKFQDLTHFMWFLILFNLFSDFLRRLPSFVAFELDMECQELR